MLTTKRVNLWILILSKTIRFFLIFYSAFILAKCVWWLISPANVDIFIQWADLDKHDKATSYITNRYPFGVIIAPKAEKIEKPQIIDQLKLTGVYLNTDRDSFAFLEYQGKPVIVRKGGAIAGSDAIVEEINESNVVVNADNVDTTISVSSGSASSNVVAAPSGSVNSNSRNSMFGGNNSATSGRGYQNSGVVPPPQPQTSPPSLQSSSEEFKQKRKKIIDEFVKSDEGGSNSDNNTRN
jgi:type II secretory pathway component PulC